MIIATLVVIVVLFFVACYRDPDSGWCLVLMLIFCGVTMYGCETSDWAKERDRLYIEEQKRKRIPRPVSSADGCTIYVFTTDRDHYFTRCGSSVSTETTWKESCGKSCSRDKSAVITTEGNK